MPSKSTRPNFALSNVRTLLAEPKTTLRNELLKSLTEFGLTNVEATGNLNEIHKSLAAGGLDLLICDTALPEGNLHDLLKSVRFSETTTNPFLVIITLISNPTPELLQDMMACGPDGILVKPFTPEQLTERVQNLIHNRKNFVVTSNYIGPERRQGHREDKIGKETIRVPNPLYNKSFGIEDLAVTKRASDVAVTRINNQMVESQSYRSGELVSDLFSGTIEIKWTEPKLTKLNELREVTFDLNRRISMTDYYSLAGLTMTLNRMLKSVHRWSIKDNKSDFNLLKILCEVLQRGFNGEDVKIRDSRYIEKNSAQDEEDFSLIEENIPEDTFNLEIDEKNTPDCPSSG